MSLHQASGRWRLGLAMALLTALSWATLPVALKITLEQLDPYTLTWFRFLVAALFMLAWLGARRGFGGFTGLGAARWGMLLVAALALIGNYVFYLLGVQHTSPGNAQLLIQLAKRQGATVITTVGSDEKASIARERGADYVILYRNEDFREAVMRITAGRGVDVVYDAVGHDTIASSIRSLKRRGLCINYGGASGLVASIEPLELGEAGSVFFTRPHLADYIATPEELMTRAADLFAAWRTGKLVVTVEREYPLGEATEAHRYLEAGRTKGKLLLRI